MAYLDYRFQDMGGLKAFLRGYFQAYKHTVITQEHFKNNLEFFSGLDLTEAFNTYIWGENSPENKDLGEEDETHKPLTDSERQLIL
jgi:predicted metalloprotease with PDZ domain